MYIVVEVDFKILTNDFLTIINTRPNKDISPGEHLRTLLERTDSKVRPYAIIHRLLILWSIVFVLLTKNICGATYNMEFDD